MNAGTNASKSTTFDGEVSPSPSATESREFWSRLSELASEAAGRCRRRNERPFNRQGA